MTKCFICGTTSNGDHLTSAGETFTLCDKCGHAFKQDLIEWKNEIAAGGTT